MYGYYVDHVIDIIGSLFLLGDLALSTSDVELLVLASAPRPKMVDVVFAQRLDEIAEVPRTLSGKKLEIPVKKLLLGGDPEKVVNRDSMANPDSFEVFLGYAAARAAN